MPISIALAGNPNCGKTTMFNMLTGSRQYVGNRPGVTVEQKTGQLRNHKGVAVVDLPGIYSLSPYTMEEVVARDYLQKQHPDVIVNLVDASNIERNLYLTTQLWEIGLPVLIALNMIDVAEKNGDKIDVDKLSRLLDCEIVPTSALHGEGLGTLCESAIRMAKRGETRTHFCRFSPLVEAALSKIAALIAPDAGTLHMRYRTVKVFERDKKVMEDLGLSAEKRGAIEAIIKKCETAYDDDSDSIIIRQRYDYITDIIRQCVVRHEIGTTVSERVDNVMTNRYLALPLFVLIMCGVYHLSVQSLGARATDWMETAVDGICGGVSVLLRSLQVAPWMNALITDGLLRGVGAVICFVPQLLILFLFLSLLEDCGYMARIAFMMDRVFRRFGLSGKSFIPLLVSSGCGVPGIMSCRTIESEKDRKITVMTTTFVPCGAKLPLVSLVAGSFFHHSAAVAISVYFLGIFMVFFSGVILKKCRFLAGNPAPFVMELPSYHLPNIKNVIRHVLDDIRAFMVKAGTVIFLASGIIWFLSNFSVHGSMTAASDSILAAMGGVLAPVFRPLGFGRWETAVATLCGIAAKENIVSSLSVLCGQGGAVNLNGLLTPLAGYSFLVFQILCSPCIAAIAAIRREMRSAKWTLFALCYQTALAYGTALVIYQLGRYLSGGRFEAGTLAALLVLTGGLILALRPKRTS